MQKEQCATIAEVVNEIGISRNTLQRWIRKKKIRAKKVKHRRTSPWLIDLKNLAEYLGKHFRDLQAETKSKIALSFLSDDVQAIREDQHADLITHQANYRIKYVPSEAFTAEEQMDRQEMLQLMNERLDQFKDCRMYNIICMRHGIRGYKPMTLREISQKVGRSSERIRQLYFEGIALLREDMLRNM